VVIAFVAAIGVAGVTTTEPPPAGTAAVALTLVDPLLNVIDNAPLPQAEAIFEIVTETTFAPERVRTTVTPSVSHDVTAALAPARLCELDGRLAANPGAMVATIVTTAATIPINQRLIAWFCRYV
jgi:hypothetical protein